MATIVFSIKMTREQREAVRELVKNHPSDSDQSTLIRGLIKAECEKYGIVWPPDSERGSQAGKAAIQTVEMTAWEWLEFQKTTRVGELLSKKFIKVVDGTRVNEYTYEWDE